MVKSITSPALTTNMNQQLKSELFQESYCIFVGKYNEKVKTCLNGLKANAIKLLKAQFKDDLFCVVIPNYYPFKKIETDLFKIYADNSDLHGSGFWGQLGMGYKDKTWTIVE